MGSITKYATVRGETRYRVRYRTPANKQVENGTFTTKRDATAFLATVEVSKSKGDYIDPKSARVTVGMLGEAWLAIRTMKPSSLRVLEIAWRIQVAPVWASVPVGDVRHSEVQAWVSSMAQQRGATTVLRAYGVLRGILDAAVRDRRLSANPVAGVTLPRKVQKPRRYLTHQQVQLLADCSGEKSTLVLFLAYTGLRWGEAVGLRVENVDTLRRRVRVEQNAVNVGGRIIVGTPKSHHARIVPYPAFLSDLLATECTGKARTGLVFGNGRDFLRSPTTRDGWFIHAKRRARAIDPTLPEVTLHDLRHTAASLSVSAGANVKVVQRMLGHASAAMTLDVYADLFESDIDSIGDALDEARTKQNVGVLWGSEALSGSNVTQLPRVSGAFQP